MISLDKCNGNGSAVMKICVPNKTKNVNVKVFNIKIQTQ